MFIHSISLQRMIHFKQTWIVILMTYVNTFSSYWIPNAAGISLLSMLVRRSWLIFKRPFIILAWYWLDIWLVLLKSCLWWLLMNLNCSLILILNISWISLNDVVSLLILNLSRRIYLKETLSIYSYVWWFFTHI